jgi:hypothetical protein
METRASAATIRQLQVERKKAEEAREQRDRAKRQLEEELKQANGERDRLRKQRQRMREVVVFFSSRQSFSKMLTFSI